ncbi:MAG: phenylacetate--CoA ligase family protein [Burkholderiaceae bacterium]
MSADRAAPAAARLLTPAQLRDLEPDQLAAFQDRKFAWYARTLLGRTSPYYARLFREHGIDSSAIDGVRAWQRLGLPLIRKDTFRADPDAFTIGARHGADTLDAYRQFVAVIGPLPPAVPIWSWPGLEVTQPIPAALATPQPDGAQANELVSGTAGVFLSGGSSGVPVPIRHSRLDRELFQIATRRLHGTLVDALHRRGDRVVSATLYPQAPHMGFWMTTWGFEAVAHMHLGLSGAGIVPTERLAELALQYSVNTFAGIPSYFRNRFVPALVDCVRSSAYRLPPRIAITLGGEPVTAACRDEVRAMLLGAGAKEVTVLGGYGASESRFHLWHECAEGAGYHSAAPDLAACRVVRLAADGSWDFVPDGEEGLLVQFPLDGSGTCLSGFILGDSVVMTHERCPHCGVRGPRLLQVGRASDLQTQMAAMGTVEAKVRGATVNFVDLREQLLRCPGVAEVQLVVRHRIAGDAASADELVVRCAASTGAEPRSLAEQVAALTKRVSEITPIVELTRLDELLGRSLKFSWLVDERQAARRDEPPAR